MTRTIFLLTMSLLFFCGENVNALVGDEDSTQALIKRGIVQIRRTHIVAYPYAYYTPETKLAIGVGGIITFYTGREKILRPSKITLAGYYSIRDQYKITLGSNLYLAQNKTFLGINLSFGQYADKFWGIGHDAPEIDMEDYISRGLGLNLDFQFVPVLDLLKLDKSGIIYDFYANYIIDKKQNPFLNSGDVRGVDGGTSSGLGYIMVKDSRDNIFFPNSGGFSRIKLIFYMQAIGSDFNFNSYEIDLRRYIAYKPDQVLAVQIFANLMTGKPPFYELPMLGGGQMMRGYYQGRYRDRHYLAGQLEYRTYFWKRFGFVAFAGMGDVADEIKRFRIRDVKVTGGCGLRFKFNPAEKVNLRMDVGFGKGIRGVYFGLEEAF